jgi:hypothetical protein
MSYELSVKELKSTVALDSNARLKHFLEKVKASGQIWTLAEGEALLVLGNEDYDQFVVVWPHSDYAMLWFEESGIEEADLVSMNVDDWLDGTLDELGEAEIGICIFPTNGDEGSFVSGSDMLALLGPKAR